MGARFAVARERPAIADAAVVFAARSVVRREGFGGVGAHAVERLAMTLIVRRLLPIAADGRASPFA